jgi:hypothetical protein
VAYIIPVAGSGAVDSVAGKTGEVVLVKGDVGLGNVDNTSDASKPVSTAQQTALNAKAASAHGHSIADTTGLQDALDGKQASLGFTAVPNTRTVAGKALSADVALVKGDVGLGNVDNTSDAAKPVSTATQTALDGKSATGHNHAGVYEPANANIQAHVVSAHAPSNAQKNSDILKAEIEAKLTGEISTHTHAGGGGADPWTYIKLAADFTTTSATADDVNNGALFGFTPAANTGYIWESVLAIRSGTATVNPRLGFAWSTGMTDGICSIEQTSTATAKVMANGNIAAALLVAVGGIPTNNSSWPAICYGVVQAGANPSGNCRMQLASETAGTTVRVVASVSYFRYRALP